jgi:hypothetical protein
MTIARFRIEIHALFYIIALKSFHLIHLRSISLNSDKEIYSLYIRNDYQTILVFVCFADHNFPNFIVRFVCWEGFFKFIDRNSSTSVLEISLWFLTRSIILKAVSMRTFVSKFCLSIPMTRKAITLETKCQIFNLNSLIPRFFLYRTKQ